MIVNLDLDNLKDTFISFSDASDKLKINKSLNGFDIVPYVVNLSFCAELGFKYLIVKNKIDIQKEHDLYVLYSKLTVIEDFNKKIFLFFWQYGYSSSGKIENELKRISKNFETWRYCYENDALETNISFLEELVRFLKGMIINDSI